MTPNNNQPLGLDIFCELLPLMQLCEGQVPVVEVNRKSAPRKIIRNLLGRKAIPTQQRAPEDLRWLVEGEEPCRDHIESVGILDLLGEYIPGSKKVILYDLLIHLCAEELGLDYQILYDVVLCHEMSHAATHLGVDQAGEIWLCFGSAPSQTTEYFAQIYTHLLFAQKGRHEVTMAMQKLSSEQPVIYKTYIENVDKDPAVINRDLLRARQQIPPGMELLQQVITTKWSVSFSNLRKYRNPHYVEPQYRGFPHIDVIYWDNEKYPWDKRWLTSGTEVNMSSEKIKVRSYDYSPSSNRLSLIASHDLYKLLVARWERLRDHTCQPDRETHIQLRVALAEDSMHLDTREPDVVAFWKDMCRIIGIDYPVLAKVLLRYEDEVKGNGELA